MKIRKENWKVSGKWTIEMIGIFEVLHVFTLNIKRMDYARL